MAGGFCLPLGESGSPASPALRAGVPQRWHVRSQSGTAELRDVARYSPPLNGHDARRCSRAAAARHSVWSIRIGGLRAALTRVSLDAGPVRVELMLAGRPTFHLGSADEQHRPCSSINLVSVDRSLRPYARMPMVRPELQQRCCLILTTGVATARCLSAVQPVIGEERT